MSHYRIQKVAALIKNELSRLLIEEIENSLLHNIIITHVEMTKDLRNAFIYFSAENKNTALKALDRSQSFFRKKLSHNIKLRTTPLLHFKHDSSLNSTINVLKILEELKEGSPL